jgi:hypothetical protein
MPTLLDHASNLAKSFPDGGPVYLSKMAEIFWPDATWLNARVNRHNGGSRRGARCAGALAGRLERAGYLRMTDTLPRSYTVKVAAIAQKLEEKTRV